ncbi:MAG TPA: flagellar motor protein MotB [Solirubrobacteraceae bacterium]|jgi:chemotaxis protein MotB
MAAGRRHKRAHHEEEHENEERWLVSFADMMTLLFCLFMVLFAISSVNTSKFEALQHALQNAFSGRILSGGKAVMQTGSDTNPSQAPSTAPPLPALSPLNSANEQQSSNDPQKQAAAAKAEQEDFVRLKRRIDQIARRDGLQGRVETTIDTRGLVVRLLTDKVFFDSGQATVKPGALNLLDAVGAVIRDEHEHPVVVEGHTDSQPIHSGQYPSNWELSGARAAAVVRVFAQEGVLQRRMSLAGYASEQPADTNTTATGRAHNRRVDVVLSRLHTQTTP